MFDDPRVWLALALAFILGWLVDWLLEILFWRGRRLQADGKVLRQKLTVQEARLRELEQALNTQRAAGNGTRITQLTDELLTARSDLAEAQQLLMRQATELDALRVAQATPDETAAATKDVLPPALDEPALPDAILQKSEEASSPSAPEPETPPPATSAQATALSHRLDDEARRVAALLSGRPYDPPPATAGRGEEPADMSDEASPISVDALASAPSLPGMMGDEDAPPGSAQADAEASPGSTGETQANPSAGTDAEGTEKKPRPRRRSR
jgi:hypothetical protein